eukprot:gene6866-4463_t
MEAAGGLYPRLTPMRPGDTVMSVLRKLPGNDKCIDCLKVDPDWASTNLGCLMCLSCSGKHRNLGVQFSFVQSIGLDQLGSLQVTSLRRGGNAKLTDFFKERGTPFAVSTPAHEKYISPTAELYRLRLAAAADGTVEGPEQLTAEQVAAIDAAAAKQAKAAAEPTQPTWVPNSSASACQICGSKFTMLKRRHHCRRCGKLVCATCAPSKNTRPIPEFNLKDPVRHCLQCYKSPGL